MAKLVVGINDLATLHPEVAAEADGWDPSTVIAGSHRRMSWKCKEGHNWEAQVTNRTYGKTGCPYCSNYKILVGFNDLKTLFPEVAKDADGWDPTTIGSGNSKSFAWKCKEGHTWKATPQNRTSKGQGCPVCSHQKVWKGVNDLQTKFPEIAKEAEGWDPSTISGASRKERTWKCQKGHLWEARVQNRTLGNNGCPICSNQKILIGFNDLQTKFPEIAAEADGWDPSTVIAGSHRRMSWKCKEGHRWKTVVKDRTGKRKRGCPYCANKKVLTGFNDLETLHPEVAAEADGWDPLTISGGSGKRMTWKCKEGHRWNATVSSRTRIKTNCPYCANKKVWNGFNDLKTLFPEIAKEADGWDPSTVFGGGNQRMSWKCIAGHRWESTISHRTVDKSGCPSCAEHGFNPDKPAWFYLMKREGEQQFGITNCLLDRIEFHSRFSWVEVETTGPHDGAKVLDTEKKLKQWLRKEIGLVPDKRENWYTAKMEVHSLAELKEKSGIETTIF